MDKKIKFRRNVYIILLCILGFAILTQVARSSLILKLNNNKQVAGHEQWASFRNEAEQTMLLVDEQSGLQHHCVVIDSRDEISSALQNNLSEVYRYMKQPYIIQDIAMEQLDLADCSAVTITTSLELLGDYVDDITNYVSNGGYYFQMRAEEPDRVMAQLYRKLGIIDYRWLESSWGIQFDKPLLIGQKDKVLGEDFFYNDSLLVELDANAIVYAKGVSGIPLIWSNQYGSGNFMIYNGNNLEEKSNRGLIVGAISLMIPGYIYPIFNEKLFYIDDFPAPISNRIDDSIYEEYGKNVSAFFRDIWWPDMIRAAKRYELKYTAVAIEVYEDDIEAPFEPARQDNLTNLISYGREVLKSGGEIGIHGYNHQPLQMDDEVAAYYDYRTWKSTDNMESATIEMLKYLNKAYPNYTPISYVPPSNIISAEGRQSLLKAWPQLKVISAVYDTDPLGFAYEQEYEVADDGIMEMPRITSGYFDTDYAIWLQANAITSLGIVSHFIHPDDLLEAERSGGKQWSELYKDFSSMLFRIESTYPWVRANTSDNAALNMGYVLSSHMTRKVTDHKVDVQLANQKITQYFILRSDKKIGKLTNCDVNRIDDGTYLVTTENGHFSIELK